MSTKKKLSRITIDLPKEHHMRIKALAAIQGKSMRDVVVELIDAYLKDQTSHSKDVLKALDKIEKNK